LALLTLLPLLALLSLTPRLLLPGRVLFPVLLQALAHRLQSLHQGTHPVQRFGLLLLRALVAGGLGRPLELASQIRDVAAHRLLLLAQILLRRGARGVLRQVAQPVGGATLLQRVGGIGDPA
jgi:hypothetical protein